MKFGLEKKPVKRRGPPAEGHFSLALETNTDLDVNVDVQVQVTQNVVAQVSEDLEMTPVRQPEGRNFQSTDFEEFLKFVGQNQSALPPSYQKLLLKELRDQLAPSWAQWFGANPARWKRGLPDGTYINQIFISVDFLPHIEQFQGGFSLEHLPVGLKKISAVRQKRAFDIVFDPPRRGQAVDFFAIPLQPIISTQSSDAKKNQLVEFKKQLSSAEKDWWLCLIAQHQKYLPEDDELALMLVFREFMAQIKARGLHFDESKVDLTSFSDVKNLRTALANILTLLDHTSIHGKNNRQRNENDVRTLWQHMSHLSLGSAGAIRGIYPPYNYSVILPQMCMDVEHDEKREDEGKYKFDRYLSSTDPDAPDNLDMLSLEDVHQHFFRSVAGEQHRYPMEFYLQAADKINRFVLFSRDKARQQHIQRVLLQLLRCSTTKTVEFCQEPWEEALARWDKILALFEKFPLRNDMKTIVLKNAIFIGSAMGGHSKSLEKEISAGIIQMLYELRNSPSLKTLQLLSEILKKDISELSLMEQDNLAKTLQVDFSKLGKLASSFGNEVYHGMRFFDLHQDNQHYETSLFHTHIQKLEDFKRSKAYKEMASPILNLSLIKSLIGLISTFSLQMNDLTDIYWCLNGMSPQVVYHTLKKLSDIVSVRLKDDQRLEANHLKRFIQELKEHPVEGTVAESVNVRLKNHFEACFPQGYFLTEIPDEVCQLVQNQIRDSSDREMVFSLLNQLKMSGQRIDYQSIVTSIKHVIKRMLPLETTRFLQHLQQILPNEVNGEASMPLSDGWLALLNDLLDESGGASHLQAFTFFFDFKQKLPPDQRDTRRQDLFPTLHFWMRYERSLFTFLQGKTVAPAQAFELCVRILWNNMPLNEKMGAKLENMLHIYDGFLQKYPTAQQSLWRFLCRYQQKITNIDQTLQDLTVLQQVFTLLTPDQVLSLCFHFNGTNEAYEGDGRTPETLLKIFERLDSQGLTGEEKKAVLSMLVAVLNQEKNLKTSDIWVIIDQLGVSGKKASLLKAIQSCYQTVPFPPLNTFMLWYEGKQIDEQIQTFSLRPCQRETGGKGEKKGENGYKNGFHVGEAHHIASQFKECLIDAGEIHALLNYVGDVRRFNTKDLLSLLARYKSQCTQGRDRISTAHLAALVAISAELLYRAKGIESKEMGSSYEINTTQYLALYAALKMGQTSHNVMSQMGTGEGKSRCVAILNVCGLAQGKAVTSLTRSLELATRDYLEFHAFYQAVSQTLGCQTNLVSVHSPISDDHANGLSISDVSHIQRFRSKAKILGGINRVLNPDGQRRMLVVDEVDLFRLHHVESKYTLSSAPDPDWQSMPWIYDAIMDFFAQDDEAVEPNIRTEYRKLSNPSPEEAFLAFDEKFLNFVAYHPRYQQECQKLTDLAKRAPERLDELYLAADQARHLIYDHAEGFGIEADTIPTLPQGVSQHSVVFPMVEKIAKFSLGLQECLSVRLNRYDAILKKNQKDPRSLSHWEKKLMQQEEKLMQALSQCHTSFFVGVQKQAEYSSTNQDLFDDYSDGICYGYSGTTGESYEREELRDTTLLTIPRHLGLQRQDKAILLAKSDEHYLQVLVNAITEARKLNQPILLLCRDDRDAIALHTQLTEALSKDPGAKNMQYISSYANDAELKHHTLSAGEAGMLTVATEKFGRGTDIKLSKAAKSAGLRTLVSYLPATERELEQMLSRSARFGDPGETRLVLNMEQLKTTLGLSSLKQDFYLAPETFIRQTIAKRNRRTQCERVIADNVHFFHRQIREYVVAEIYPNYTNTVNVVGDVSSQKQVRSLWAKFLQKQEAIWGGAWAEIKASLNTEHPDIEEINQSLMDYRIALQQPLDEFNTAILQIPHDDGVKSIVAKNVLPALGLRQKSKDVLGAFDLEKHVPHLVVSYSKYDEGHNGRAIAYTRPFVKLWETLMGRRPLFADLRAWYRGEGILWPNLQAWRAGKLNFFQALTCYNGTVFQFITLTDTSKKKSFSTKGKQDLSLDQNVHVPSLRDLFSSSANGLAHAENPRSDHQQGASTNRGSRFSKNDNTSTAQMNLPWDQMAIKRNASSAPHQAGEVSKHSPVKGSNR